MLYQDGILKAPAYTTLPVQPWAEISVMEDVDGVLEGKTVGVRNITSPPKEQALVILGEAA